MFASGRRKSSSSSSLSKAKQHEDEEERNQLTTSLMNSNGSNQLGEANNLSIKNHQLISSSRANQNKTSKIQNNNNNNDSPSKKKKAKLARLESIGDEEGDEEKRNKSATCVTMVINLLKKKRIFIPLIILICMAAIYCVPYVEIQARIPKSLPHIPFNFQNGPLRASSASQFKIEHLFRDQVRGPESVALDSQGNMYMAIEGGFILYAHLNKSSPLKRSYYGDSTNNNSASLRYTMLLSGFNNQPHQSSSDANLQLEQMPNLVKIAELNGIKQLPYNSNNNNNNNNLHENRRARLADHFNHRQQNPTELNYNQQRRQSRMASSWRRECQLDEKVYGNQLYSAESTAATAGNEIDTSQPEKGGAFAAKFTTLVHISRCSKPLGVRLSQDESYLYVVDTLSGLYRVNLKVAERPYSSQRLVNKLIDFRNNKHQLLPVVRLDLPEDERAKQAAELPPLVADHRSPTTGEQPLMFTQTARGRAYLNVSLLAVDDLVVDYGAGSRGGDIIYLSLASQNWQAVSFVYDALEGRPSAAVLRFDTGSNQLSVLNPAQVSLVRTSANLDPSTNPGNLSKNPDLPYLGLGAPRLDENDVFDDRPLSFTNGLEITDDKQALLIVDTVNKRIIKHYIRGDRRGTSDHWAWTPNFPDNIRRGADKRHETYWVVGCGQGVDNQLDLFDLLREWPMLRKYILKNFYLFGWVIEQFGAYLLDSTSVRDFGYSIKIGHTFCEKGCSGMMILQYNKYGDIIRTIHGKEFPHDTIYYSQVNEVIDAINQEHVLYLSSPSYSYVTKLTLPTDSFVLPSPAPLIIDNNVQY